MTVPFLAICGLPIFCFGAAAVPTPSLATEPCFAMHGSIKPEAGHPTYRISPETKTGWLAVRDGDNHPSNLWSLFPSDQRAVETTVTGDFIVCPLEPAAPNRVRIVRIKSAKHLQRKIDDWLERNVR